MKREREKKYWSSKENTKKTTATTRFYHADLDEDSSTNPLLCPHPSATGLVVWDWVWVWDPPLIEWLLEFPPPPPPFLALEALDLESPPPFPLLWDWDLEELESPEIDKAALEIVFELTLLTDFLSLSSWTILAPQPLPVITEALLPVTEVLIEGEVVVLDLLAGAGTPQPEATGFLSSRWGTDSQTTSLLPLFLGGESSLGLKVALGGFLWLLLVEVLDLLSLFSESQSLCCNLDNLLAADFSLSLSIEAWC